MVLVREEIDAATPDVEYIVTPDTVFKEVVKELAPSEIFTPQISNIKVPILKINNKLI